jgi:hypothetical protein
MSLARLVGALASAAALLTGGCVEDQEVLIVLGAPGWQATMAGGCLVNPSSDVFLSFGVLDLYCANPDARCQMLAPSYWIPVALQNNLTASMDNASTSELQLKDVEVIYSIPQDEALLDGLEGQRHFTLPLATDSLPPGSPKGLVIEAVNTTQAGLLYEQIAAAHPEGFSDVTLIVTLIFHAERTATSGDFGTVESRDFEFPIKMCEGCLFSCSSCEDGVCPQTDPAELVWTGGVCGNSQDGPLYPTICGG